MEPNSFGVTRGEQPLVCNGDDRGQRASPLRLLPMVASTSPKGRGLGKKMKFAWTAKGSHFGGAGIAQR